MKYLATFFLVACAFCARAAETPSGTQASDAEVTRPQNIFPLAEELSGSKIAQKRDDYLKKRGWALGYSRSNPNSAYIGWGDAKIQAKPDDLKFGQSRVLAFETALIEAKGEFVRFKKRQTTTETARTFFQDSGDLPPDAETTESSRAKIIWDKIVALTEAKLDKALAENGVDMANFKGKTLEQKRKLAQDSIRRTINIKAIGSVAGLRTLATFEDLDSVGVLIVYSDNQHDLAKAILSGRQPAHSTGAAQQDDILKQIDALCPNGPKDLADTFGVRVMTDENGDRVLVSFGQWSAAVAKTDSRFRRDNAIKGARAQAQNLADGDLTDFLRSTVELDESSSVWQDQRLTRIISPTATEEVEALAIGDAITKTLKQTGSATLSGVMTIKEWTANHPETGHLLVGHILMWSPSSSEAAVHGLTPSSKPNAKDQRKYDNKVRVSPDFDKNADF